MWQARRNRDQGADAERPLVAVEVNDGLPVEHVEGLLLGGMGVQWSDFVLPCDLLDEQICPVRLGPGRLQSQEVVVEPEPQ